MDVPETNSWYSWFAGKTVAGGLISTRGHNYGIPFWFSVQPKEESTSAFGFHYEV